MLLVFVVMVVSVEQLLLFAPPLTVSTDAEAEPPEVEERSEVGWCWSWWWIVVRLPP